MKQLLSLFLLLASLFSNSQIYTNLPVNLADVGRSMVSWSDYDNDGDLDLFISGLKTDGSTLSAIYRNDEGAFTDINASLEGMKETAAAWGDYDNDGDHDLIVCGNTANGDKTYIYSNDGQSFNLIQANLAGVSNGDVAWADYDNDGDLDIFLTGSWMTKIYNQDSGEFAEVTQDFGYWGSSRLAPGDYDNDGDVDLLLIGDSGAGAITKLFNNAGGTFTPIDFSFPGLLAGTADWIDYDNDGDLDVALSGYNDALEAQYVMYTNEGKGNFTIFYSGIDAMALSASDWGDYDNDGDLDVICTGKATGCGAATSGIYTNEFPYFIRTSDVFTTAMRGSVSWADFENDGDLDFIVSGLDLGDSPFTKLYRNIGGSNSFEDNTLPAVPDNLQVTIVEDEATFTWNRASDGQSLHDALSYNFYLATSPAGNDILSPMSDPLTGFRRVPSLGNTNQDTTWKISGLASGTYFWSVQAIDQAFSGSLFAQEQSFDIILTKTPDQISNYNGISLFPNPVQDVLTISSESLNIEEIEILSMVGERIHLSEGKLKSQIELSGLSPGIYMVRVTSGNDVFTYKLLKN
jgi:hypothetical protein